MVIMGMLLVIDDTLIAFVSAHHASYHDVIGSVDESYDVVLDHFVRFFYVVAYNIWFYARNIKGAENRR